MHGQNHDIKIANRCFENVAQFRYLGTTISNQNLSQEVIKRRLKSGYLCYWVDVMSVITSHVSTHCVCPQLTQHGLLRGAGGQHCPVPAESAGGKTT
jgi:hypothetical protein